ncbi:HicB family protein, partial [Haemophilus influenzae]
MSQTFEYKDFIGSV